MTGVTVLWVPWTGSDSRLPAPIALANPKRIDYPIHNPLIDEQPRPRPNEKEQTKRETEGDEPVAVKMEREGDEDAQLPNAKRQRIRKRLPKSGEK